MPLTTLGLAERVNNGYANFGYIALGTSQTAFAESQTALQGSELDRNAVGSTSKNSNIITLEALFTNAEAIGTVGEIAIFDAASGGNMLYRKVIDPTVSKTALKAAVAAITLTDANV